MDNNNQGMNNNPPTIKVDPMYYEQQHQHLEYQPQQQEQVNRLKRTLTLDLNKSPVFKKSRLGHQSMLSSPDLKMLKLATPELENMIMQNQNGSLTTPTPSLLFPRTATEEQELYARGFEVALNHLHNSDSSSQLDGPQGPETPVTYTTLESHPQHHQQSISPPNNILQGMEHGGYLASSCSGSTSSGASSPVSSHYGASMSPANTLHGHIRIKEEPLSLSGNTPPMSPIDMDNQVHLKLERKRQRNRIAASKCRKRKLERITKLQVKVDHLKGENSELSIVINRLKEHVCKLKEQVMEHVKSGCQISPVASLNF
ncbi:Hypothetical predicted protein [Cloeon dipterum]|uniref:BZIP domain-containing protein n=1 Tax=Cloeon dipterum TaxID=197152 RepID=A0A8S1CZ85_9INSE|nr:Hypothetical predicted protein [Cloeon dipterum]